MRPYGSISRTRRLSDGLTSASMSSWRFLLVLLDRERIPCLPAIAREIRVLVDAKAGRVRAQVTSALPLALAQTKEIQSALERLAGNSVILKSVEDPEILGGVIAQIGDVVYDGSLKTKLERMRERFMSH